MKDEELSTTRAGAWTRAEDYVLALAQRRTARRSRRIGQRTQPETPLFSLSTLPFLILIGAVTLLAAAIIVTAWPVNRPPREKPPQANEIGTASKGWFDEARREFHR